VDKVVANKVAVEQAKYDFIPVLVSLCSVIYDFFTGLGLTSEIRVFLPNQCFFKICFESAVFSLNLAVFSSFYAVFALLVNFHWLSSAF